MTTNNHPVILGTARTPFGKFGGGLAPLSAIELGAIVMREAMQRADIDKGDVTHNIMGCVVQAGLGQVPSRQAAFKAGLGYGNDYVVPEISRKRGDTVVDLPRGIPQTFDLFVLQGETGEVLIVLFGNLNAVALAQLHDDVEKVHAVELELLAERLFGDEARKVFVRSDVGQNVEDFLADISGGHGEYFLMITTELIPSIPNELFKMYSARFRRRGSPTMSVINAHSGSSSSTLIV